MSSLNYCNFSLEGLFLQGTNKLFTRQSQAGLLKPPCLTNYEVLKHNNNFNGCRLW